MIRSSIDTAPFGEQFNANRKSQLLLLQLMLPP
jgi:hypothetical protein